MPSEYPKFPVGVNAFVVRDGKLLLGKRKNVYGAGTWALPGGHLESGESMIFAVGRELREETGLIANEFTFVSLVNDHRDGELQYMQVGFFVKDAMGDPKVCEPDRCDGWQWFSIDDLPNDLFVAHKKLIQNFFDGRHFDE
ncbi:MAG: NUDIX domain-containing protein [Patescibacteria group bacterium]|jgi:8-oxo-dGTP diphosphatase